HDWIFCSIRISTVTADAMDGDIDGIDVGVGITLRYPNVTNLHVGFVVKAEGVIWFRPARVKSVPQHGTCTDAELFRRLPDESDRAVPLVFHFRERTRHSDDHRNVSVVPAGVHDVDIVAFFIFRYDRAGVGQSCFFLIWQRVEVGPHQGYWPVAIFDQYD